MIIIGNEHIDAPVFVKIASIDDIKTTQPSNIVVFNYDVQIAKYCNENDVAYAIMSDDIKDVVFANALNASYIIVEHNGIQIQKLAENYMFDVKILQIIEDDSAIEQVALCGIDGVIYKNSIKGL
jgi:hypothetical protein